MNRHKHHSDVMETPITTRSGRLSTEQVARYRTEGYLKYDEPIFPKAKFEGLRQHFDLKLAALSPDVRPEAMDVPHFNDTKLFEWLFADEVLDLVQPIIGPDIVLFSSHFICKPKGNGKRVPWHEDSYYWRDMLSPMEVCTVWLAVDSSTTENGCMNVIPRTHDHGFSEYEDVDLAKNVFPTEIQKHQFDPAKAVAIELQQNQASLHDGKLMHGSEANTSAIRRCGYTMRYVPSHVVLNEANYSKVHHLYLARGRDRSNGANKYADPAKCYPEMARYRESQSRNFH